jgi:hypothetical protein
MLAAKEELCKPMSLPMNPNGGRNKKVMYKATLFKACYYSKAHRDIFKVMKTLKVHIEQFTW